VEPASVASQGTPYSGPVYTVAIGKFNNRSTYMRGIFSDGTDRLGNQAKTILQTHLAQTGRFRVVDRGNLGELEKEAALRNTEQKLSGARVVFTGEVTEFGRRVTGDKVLFGIIGRGKKQTAYAKVSLNIVDVETSEVIFSTQGAGEYHLSDREVIGTGGASGYDSTLNGKVLNLAIMETVNRVVEGLESHEWSAESQPKED
jgi:curli biogenesis system outer membrane secretion channel CsgG